MLITDIKNLLNRKKSLFLELEKATEDMNTLEFQELVDRIDERNRILKDVEEIDTILKEELLGKDHIKAILNNTLDRETLKDEELEVYLLSLEIKAVVNRIMQYDDLIRMHLDFEKQRILEKVQKLNTSSTSVAEKYQKSVETGVKKPLNNFKKNTI